MDLYEATLDGYTLEIETLDDTFEKAIARHEFPFRDGALLEDMGQKAHLVKIRCYFWDDGADHYSYADHVNLINHLKSRELFELVHPQYGVLHGCVESVTVRHDDRQMTAEVDITFVENRRGMIDDVAYEEVEAAAEGSFVAAQQEAMETFAADARTALGAEATRILAQPLVPELPILEQFTGLSLQARAWVREVNDYVVGLEADLVEIANPANSLIAAISYGTNLPGRVIGAVARCVERYAILFDSLKSSPVRFLNSLIHGLRQLETAFAPFAKTTRISAAGQVALQAAYLYRADQDERRAQQRNEKSGGFDLLGRYTAPAAVEPVMTVNELERSLADVRGYLQEAIGTARESGSLKALALSLLTHVNTVKLQREKIIPVELDNPIPLHLVCLRYGLPYQAAERLLTINSIRNPNIAAGRINVYGR